MKTKLLTAVTATLLLGSSLIASQKFIGLGYASANIDGTSRSGLSVDIGLKFGDTYKQKVGLEVAMLGEDNEMNEDLGNLGDIYYNLGYEVLKDVVAYASIGYGFQSIANTEDGSIYASGISYGAGANYEINDMFELGVSYKLYNLEYLGLSYSANVANINVAYKF